MNTRRKTRVTELGKGKKNRLASGAALVAAVTLLLTACAGIEQPDTEQPNLSAACNKSSKFAQKAWLERDTTAFIIGETQHLSTEGSHAISAWMGMDETGCFINFSLTDDEGDLHPTSRLVSVQMSKNGSTLTEVLVLEGYRNENVANFRLHLDDFSNGPFYPTYTVMENGMEREVTRYFELVREVAFTADGEVQVVWVEWK